MIKSSTNMACHTNNSLAFQFTKSLRRLQIQRSRAIVLVFLTAAACSNPSVPPAPTNALGSDVPVTRAGPGDVPNSLVYRAPDLDTRPPPSCFHIPPALIATGKGTLFLEVNDQEKQLVAEEVTAAFRHALRRHQQVSDVAQRDCADLQLYLTGVTKSTPVQNADQGAYSNILGMSDVPARNLQASVNGSITVAGKFVAPNGDILAGFVNKVGTGSFDIPQNASQREILRLAAARIANDIAGAVDREVVLQKHNKGV